MRLLLGCACFALLATPALATRTSLGTFEGWGAFRDDQPLRCYAIAEPLRKSTKAAWRAFASVSHWPGQGVRGQTHVRLSRERSSEAVTTLRIGGRRFVLVGGGADAWAPDARTDAAIVAAMRNAQSMTIDSRDGQGRGFSDTYRLRGAATAIDAAALGCVRR